MSVNVRRVSNSGFLSAHAGDDLGDGDAGKACLAAAAAPHTERFLVGLDKSAVLVIVAVLETGMPFGPEVVAARHLGEVDDVAGIERLGLFCALQVDRDGLFHTVAVTGGADI